MSEPGAVAGDSAAACRAEEGCAYLRTLSTIEHLAGFDHTARAYAAAAERFREEGCRAPNQRMTQAAAAPILLRMAEHRRRPRAMPTPDGGETVPFVRSALLDAVADAAGNWVERRALKLETLPQRGDSLGSLYRHWRDLRGAGVCQFSNIDTVLLQRADLIGRLHVIDVSRGDPQDFRFELFGHLVSRSIGCYESPRAHPVRIWADCLMQDYDAARLAAKPRLHRMRCHVGDLNFHYTRLILPFHDKRGRVSRLLVAIRGEPGDLTPLRASKLAQRAGSLSAGAAPNSR